MRFEIQHQQRAQHARIAHGGWELQYTPVHGAIDEPEIQPQRRRAAIRSLERSRQRIEQPCQNERQRLQRVDRPLELHPLNEARNVRIRHERPGIQPQRELPNPHAVLPHAR